MQDFTNIKLVNDRCNIPERSAIRLKAGNCFEILRPGQMCFSNCDLILQTLFLVFFEEVSQQRMKTEFIMFLYRKKTFQIKHF